MFVSLRFLKKINFDKLRSYRILQRYHSIPKYTYNKPLLFVDRGLFAVHYANNIYNPKYKYGMFAFIRKPFARPLKKSKLKKR